MIEWNEVDLLTCLEVEPEVDADRLYYRYVRQRNDITLDMVVGLYDEDVQLILRRPDEGPLVSLWMRGCQAIRYVRRDNMEQLVFLSREERHFHPNLPYGMCLQVAPSLRLVLGDRFTAFEVG